MIKPILLTFLLLSILPSSYAQVVDASIEFPSQDWIQPFPIKITVNNKQQIIVTRERLIQSDTNFKDDIWLWW